MFSLQHFHPCTDCPVKGFLHKAAPNIWRSRGGEELAPGLPQISRGQPPCARWGGIPSTGCVPCLLCVQALPKAACAPFHSSPIGMSHLAQVHI